MADTYTAAAKARLIEDGTRTGTHGPILNSQGLELIDDMASGVESINIGSSTTYALAALSNGTDSESRASCLKFTGTPASAVTVTAPASVVDKRYRIENSTGQRLTMKYAASTGVMFGNLDKASVWCNGTEVYDQGPGSRITAAEIAASVVPVDYAIPSHEADGIVRASRYGAGSSATAAQNLARIKDAISVAAQLDYGVVLHIPADDGVYAIDTSGGESTAIEIAQRMTVIIDGDLQSSFGAIQANPPTIFLVSGDNVTFKGSGKLLGDGTTNDVNTGTEATFPSLVKVTGDYFTMTELTVEKPYKIGVFLYGCDHAKVTGNNFTGGVTTYSDTAYFAVRINQGTRHIISNNQFYPASGGGMYVNCIFSNGTSFCLVDSNVCYRPYEKLAYINGTHCVISNNIIVGNTGTITGTSQAGTVGPAIRHDGAFGKITNNLVYYCGAGISAVGGGGCTIEGNTLINVGQSAISVFDGSGVFDYLSIRNNICVCGDLTGITVINGIYVNPPSGTNFYFDISHNQVVGFAPAAGSGAAGIWVEADGGGLVNERCLISYNNIGPGSTACRIGIYLGYTQQSIVSNNRMRCTVYGIQEANGQYNRYLNNSVDSGLGAVVGIQGLNAASYGEGNIYNATLPLSTNVTLAGGVATVTIASSVLAVAANAQVYVQPTNLAAAAYVAANGLYATVTSPNAILTSGNGTNFGGTETFNVRVIQ